MCTPMPKIRLYLSLALVGAFVNAFGAENSAGKLVSLKPYSAGVQVGALGALNDDLADYSGQFLEFSFIQQFEVSPRVNMFLDLDYMLPDNNFGGRLGGDYLFASGGFRPFVGMGIGMHYFEKDGGLAESFGPSATAHFGFLFDVMDEVQLRVRVPYLFVLNKSRDNLAGLEIGMLFSSPHRKTRVQKL